MINMGFKGENVNALAILSPQILLSPYYEFFDLFSPFECAGNHKIKKFNVLQASVRAYKRNLNSHKVYKKFRSERAKLRERGEKINSLKLVKYLDKYAETGKLYTQILEKIIKQNSLMDFDQSKLLPTKSFIKSNI